MEATGTFDVHEKTIGGLYQPLELVLGLLVRKRGVEEILGHFVSMRLIVCEV
jgi:hypothetical protein